MKFSYTKIVLALAISGTVSLGYASTYLLVAPIDKSAKPTAPGKIQFNLRTYNTFNTVFGRTFSFDFKNSIQISSGHEGEVSKFIFSAGTALPPGLELNGSTLSGSSNFTGQQPFEIVATLNGESKRQTYSLRSAASFTLAEAILPVSFTGHENRLINFNNYLNSPADGPTSADLTWEIVDSALPAGLFLNPTTGVLEGIATQAYSTPINVKASSGANTFTQRYVLTGQSVDVAINDAVLPTGHVGDLYNFDLKSLVTVTGDPDYNQAELVVVDTTILPPGLSVSSTGQVTGRPMSLNYQPEPINVLVEYKGLVRVSATIELPVRMGAKLKDGHYEWADGTYPNSCKEYRQPGNSKIDPSTIDGKYRIQPSGWVPTDVHCDMTTDGGGWTLTAWNKGAGHTSFNRDLFVTAVDAVNVGTLSNNAMRSINSELFSKTVRTKDAMLIVPAMNPAPYIENNQGIWSYDNPDCAGLLGHSGRYSGCVNHTANDNWDTADRFNIAIYGGPNNYQNVTNALVPYYYATNGEFCFSGFGTCEFFFYLR